jgi:uncharacterized membrane protein (UPF0127 family)
LTNGFNLTIPLDVLHLDRDGRVLRVLAGIKPWRLGPIVRGGKSVVELPAGTAARTATVAGDSIALRENTDHAAA